MLRHAWHSISCSTCHDILCVEFHGVQCTCHKMLRVTLHTLVAMSCHDIFCVQCHYVMRCLPWHLLCGLALIYYCMQQLQYVGAPEALKKQLGQCGNNKKLCKFRQTKGGSDSWRNLLLKYFKKLYQKYQDTRIQELYKKYQDTRIV